MRVVYLSIVYCLLSGTSQQPPISKSRDRLAIGPVCSNYKLQSRADETRISAASACSSLELLNEGRCRSPSRWVRGGSCEMFVEGCCEGHVVRVEIWIGLLSRSCLTRSPDRSPLARSKRYSLPKFSQMNCRTFAVYSRARFADDK